MSKNKNKIYDDSPVIFVLFQIEFASKKKIHQAKRGWSQPKNSSIPNANSTGNGRDAKHDFILVLCVNCYNRVWPL